MEHTKVKLQIGMNVGGRNYNANMIYPHGAEQDSHALFSVYGVYMNRGLGELEDCEGLQNARRLVACWNACEELSAGTQQLESGMLRKVVPDKRNEIDALTADRDRLQALNAELVGALKKLMLSVEYIIEDGTLPITAIEHESMVEARAALAKSKETH